VTLSEWLKQSPLDRTDAESLLCHVLSRPRSYLYSHCDEPISNDDFVSINTASDRRAAGEPLAYIIGEAEFWSLPFTVTPDVLIPRDDTGSLVEVALDLIKRVPETGSIVDAGTGSGAGAIAVAYETGQKIIATERSKAALEVAAINAKKHTPDLIEFVHGYWLDSIDDQSVCLLLSNPPYIAFADPHLDAPELTHEPQSALVAGRDGLSDLRILAMEAARVLVPGGAVAFEHGYDQAEAVQALLRDAGLIEVTTVQDLSGNDRVTHARTH